MTNIFRTETTADYKAQGLAAYAAHLRSMNVVAVHYVTLKGNRAGMVHEYADGQMSKATKI